MAGDANNSITSERQERRMVAVNQRSGIEDSRDQEHGVATREEPCGTGTVVTDAERQQLAVGNTTQQDNPRDVPVPLLVANQAAVAPEAVALVADGQVLTYHELNARANQLAHYLQTLGVGPEVLVGVCLERSIDMVVSLLGIMKAGGAYVPLDPAYPPKRLAFMLEDTQAPVLISCEDLAARLPAQHARVVCLDRDASVLARHNPAEVASDTTATHLAYVIYTSGSTGQPKGVQISHTNVLNLIFWHRRAFSVTPADRATQLAGPAFDATGWELWPYLTAGASVYLADEETRVTPVRLRDWLLDHQITITFLPTALAERIITLEWPRETSLRCLLTGADTLHRYPSPELPFTLVNNYGPTEYTVVTTSGPVLPSVQHDVLPTIGRPIANTQVYFLDAQLHQVPIGETGELYIGGAGLSCGYLHRPDLTAERFIRHPFSDEPDARLYRTGDLARLLPDGQIAFLGRADGQIKIRGYRIEPDEIVSVLNDHAAIQTSVVRAREDPAGEKSLVAYIVLASSAPATVASLQEHLRSQLPDYMIPASFVQLDALPLTPNGKADYAALPTPDATNTLRDDPGVETEPETGAEAEALTMIEERVAEIVSTYLHVEPVGLDENFFMLGGHSMLGAQVIARLADTFGVEIPLRTLFDGPTVRELSAEIERLIVGYLETMSDEEAQQLV
jgi:amino acid adenylation domain-containing protein